jgi:hypothetical protein
LRRLAVVGVAVDIQGVSVDEAIGNGNESDCWQSHTKNVPQRELPYCVEYVLSELKVISLYELPELGVSPDRALEAEARGFDR